MMFEAHFRAMFESLRMRSGLYASARGRAERAPAPLVPGATVAHDQDHEHERAPAWRAFVDSSDPRPPPARPC